MTLTEKQKELIEKLGVRMEQIGIAPAPARVSALLFVSDETELTFDDIQHALNLSKSSVSNAINLLLTMGQIEYVTRPGERKRYFRSRVMNWQENMLNDIKERLAFKDLMMEVLEQRPDSTPEFNRHLREMIRFMEYLFKEIERLFENRPK
ncbi:MAG TPA: MarR family transcriptional regulator [Patescibacteria group bacterium]|nr:MarR family transcriptional regulator [Patescibacteria group bacterium]